MSNTAQYDKKGQLNIVRIKAIIKKQMYSLFRALAGNKYILFESAPDFSDNTKAVFDEMVRQGIGDKYTLVWVVQKGNNLPEEHSSVRYIQRAETSIFSKLRWLWYAVNAKCMICCNKFLTPEHPETTSFYLAHGTPMKRVRHYYNVPEDIQYCLSASANVEKMTAYEFCVDESKMFSLGYPRNDVFSHGSIDIKTILNTGAKKVIVWYPTFRQHKSGRTTGSQHAFPIIHDAKTAYMLNDYAKQHDALIVLKPHFAQDMSQIKSQNLSNILLIDDEFFVKNKISSYEFVGSCDALITDYSSIYFDFTLCNKPIGLVWEDIEDYRKEPGFAVDLDYYAKGAEIIYSFEDFQVFIKNVSTDNDVCRKDREEIRDLVNYSTDGKNSERVVQFIKQKASL